MFWTFVDPDQVASGEVMIQGERAHHLGRVLRVRRGEEGVVVAASREYRVVVSDVHRDLILARIVESVPLRTEPEIAVTVLQSLLPNPDFDAVVEGATAVGMSRLIAVEAARSIRRSGPDRRTRWMAIAESAAAQSHRGRIPEILGPMALAEAIGRVTGTLLVLDPGADTELKTSPKRDGAVCLAVGPEGGWTEAELATFSRAGARTVNLGPRILRARLAPVIATAILVAQS
ncbi:MAG TPA: 16S rRNA (uracil(1498)-N(3))-methyltransferase [Candidatus Dormibacteraeota bacterium]|jgi:16S rRNA (uracil1498-N3)-methyltransferase